MPAHPRAAIAATLSSIMLSATVLASLAAAPAIAAPPAPADTVVLVDPRGGWLSNQGLQELRAPDATISGSAWTAAQNGEAYLSAGAWIPALGQSVSFQLWAGTGNDIQLGQTYTGLPLWYNRSFANPGSSCEQATVTVWELVEDLATNAVTKLALDATCPNGPGQLTIRINSSRPYAWLSASHPEIAPVYPGMAIDTTWTLTAHGTRAVSVSGLATNGIYPDVTLGDETCSGATLAPGASCTAALHIVPATRGWLTTALKFNADLDRTDWRDGISYVVLDPWGISATTLPLGPSPATVTTSAGMVTMSFTGPGSGSIKGASITGPDAASFAVSDDGCTGQPLVDGQTCTVAVTATPTAVGSIAATLIVDDGSPWPKEVALTASGTNPVSITPSVVLDTIRPGQTADAVVTLSTAGTVDLPIGTPTLAAAGGWMPYFFGIVGNTCVTGIPALGSCTITVRFTAPLESPPQGENTRSALLEVSGPGLVGYRSTQITGSFALPSLDATWTTRGTIARRWNFGNALGRAVDGSTVTFVQATSSGYVGSKLVKDAGPYMPVYINRSTNGGSSWSSSTRVNPTSKHGFWPVAAASGRNVAVAWVSAARVVNYSTTAPRVLWVRTSNSSGNGGWGTTHRITSTSGRVDHPSVAISGSTVVLGWTDSGTGDVKIAISKDRGATWKTIKMGTTSVKAQFGGKTGLTAVAVSGKTIAVAWIGSLYGNTKVRISTNGGSSFSTATSLAGASDQPALAIAGSRVGVAWLGAGLSVRVRTAGTWGPIRTVPTGWGYDENGDPTSYQIYGPFLALFGTSGIAAGASGQYSYCGACDPGTGSDLVWSETSTNGVWWTQPDHIATASDANAYNDDASVVWPSATERFVLLNRCCAVQRTTLVHGTTTGLAPASIPDAAAALDAEGGVTVVTGDAGQRRHEPAGFGGPWGAAAPPRR